MNLLSNNITNNSNTLNDSSPIISNTMASNITDSNPPDTSSFTFSPLNIGSLNCRGLAKTADTSVRNYFIRYLKHRPLDLLALQETHASTTSLQELFHSQFQASSSLWSSHCGLISFNPSIIFSNSFISPCKRFISTTVSHSSDTFDPLTVTTVYFPAVRAERYSFLSNILVMHPDIFLPSPERTIILGDFNYSYSRSFSSRPIRQAPTTWLQYIDNNFFDGITPPDSLAASTFHRGSSQSCIDYVMVSSDLYLSVCLDKCRTLYIQPAWSDHCLLTCHLRLSVPNSGSSVSSVGKGIWRANPRLALNSEFQDRLKTALTKCVASLDFTLANTTKWETLKHVTAKCCRSFSRREAFNLSRAEDLLHKKRSGLTKKLLLDPTLLPVLSPQLTIVEHQLSSLQQYHVENLALRSGIRWRELGEISAGYLKRTVATRTAKKLIPPLIHHSTLSPCTSKEEMLDTTAEFYGNLYSPDDIDQSSIDHLLESLPESLRLSSETADKVIAPIDYDDLLDAFSRSPKKSSPGKDGLPYEIVRLIIEHPACRTIALAVYNDALSYAHIPETWLQSCVSLLPKKPPYDTLKNFRPISLINTDAKVFTRILSSRMISTATTLITPYQTGFLRGRFIADNGLLMKLIMEHAKSSKSVAIGLLLDQEKAYDRVHPAYLRAVLLRFGYPLKLVDCIDHLFFGNNLQINVNGFLTSSIAQRRGLKQGDPLSPILFNLAFEPLLRLIQQDQQIHGFSLPSSPESSLSLPAPTPVKLMAYADDIVVFLNSPTELSALQRCLSIYSSASNALVNFHKTEAISLSGSTGIYNSRWRSALSSYNITTWHDCQSPKPVIYLGFPLFTSIAQRDSFLDTILDTITKACQIHQQRSLSVRGRATIVNTLILSKLWHVLRVVSTPVSFLNSIQSIVMKFINTRIFPSISFSTACLPRNRGGLSLIHPTLQQSALQLRWIFPLLSSSTSDILDNKRLTKSIVLPRLIHFLYYQVAQMSLNPSWYRTPPLDLDHRFYFLFPQRRPYTTKNTMGSLFLLFKAIDLLPKSYSQVIASTATCLELPFVSLLDPSQPAPDVLPRSLLRLPGFIAYTLHINASNCTRPRVRGEFALCRNLAYNMLRKVSQNEVKLSTFFVRTFIPPHYAALGTHAFTPVSDHSVIDLSPFLMALHFKRKPGMGRSTLLNTKKFRSICSSPNTRKAILPPPFSPRLSPPWSDFWDLPLSHSCRNIWYRFLQKKLPHKSLLHRLIPDFFPAPNCPLCIYNVDSFEHFIFTCPLKLPVWQFVWHKYVNSSTPLVSPSVLYYSLFTLSNFSRDSGSEQMEAIAATLESIWILHWGAVFNDTPFTVDSAISLVSKKILKSRHESLVSAGIPHVPLPFITAD